MPLQYDLLEAPLRAGDGRNFTLRRDAEMWGQVLQSYIVVMQDLTP